MISFLTFLLGLIGGYAAYSVMMKVSFKQRMIDDKIKVFASIVQTWVRMRNYIFAHHPGYAVPEALTPVNQEFDQMYGQSQQFIAEAILVCDDESLTTKLDRLNEELYRTPWDQKDLTAAAEAIEKFKKEAMLAVAEMRNDVRRSTRLELSDLSHILSGLVGRST